MKIRKTGFICSSFFHTFLFGIASIPIVSQSSDRNYGKENINYLEVSFIEPIKNETPVQVFDYMDNSEDYSKKGAIKKALISVINNELNGSEQQKIENLEEKLSRAEKISLEDKKEITSFLKKELKQNKREYEPIKEISLDEIDELDSNSIIPYYRFVKINGIDYFQELFVDKNGNYYINPEKQKPVSEMTTAEKLMYKTFEMTGKNRFYLEWRNMAFGEIDKKLEKNPSY